MSKRAMGMYMASNDEGSVSFLLHSHPDLSTLSSNQPLHQHLSPLPSPGKVHHPPPPTPLLLPPTTSTQPPPIHKPPPPPRPVHPSSQPANQPHAAPNKNIKPQRSDKPRTNTPPMEWSGVSCRPDNHTWCEGKSKVEIQIHLEPECVVGGQEGRKKERMRRGMDFSCMCVCVYTRARTRARISISISIQ